MQNTTTEQPLTGVDSTKTPAPTITATMTGNPAIITPKTIIPLPNDQLLEALYWIWDAFDRANVPWFLAGKTARDAIRDFPPEGDKLEIGIRKNEWTSGGRRILEAYITPVSETNDLVTYQYGSVPILMHVYEDSDCIIQTNTFMYQRESFSVPNPFSEYERLYVA